MRRVALVAPALGGAARRELESTLDWLASLPLGGLSRHLRLSEVPLDLVDVLWVTGAAEPDPRLGRWLEAGGRLLASGEGALVGAALGEEADPPVEIHLDDIPPDYGLAGFGPHPMFAGLGDGAFVRPPAGVVRSLGGAPPPRAGIVAVERRGLELVPERILAWEYSVGHGGVLCLGCAPAIAGPEAAILLANALVGDGVPHRDRGAVPLWPPRGTRAVAVAADEGFPLAAPDPWPEASLPAPALSPAARWTHTGRRVLIRACPREGTREVWAPPVRVMHGARAVGAVPCAPVKISATGLAGGLAAGGHRLLERWLAAPDVALAVWEISGPGSVPLTLEWEVDLRRAWPFPAGAYGDLHYTLDEDGRAVRVAAAAGPGAVFMVSGGRLDVQPLEAPSGPALRLRCAGATPVRIVAAAGADGEELQRSLRVLARDGVPGLAASRERRADQLRRYGTAFEAPDELLGLGFEWARERGDEGLVGAPAIGRSLLTGCPRQAPEDAWCFGAPSCAAAAAQLIAGQRDPARDVLRFLARTQRPDGSVAAWVPLGGSSSAGDPASTTSFLDLAERFLAWTGETDALRRLRVPIGKALCYLAEQRGEGPVPAGRVLDAMEDLAEGAEAVSALAALRRRSPPGRAPAPAEAHALLEAATAALRRDPGAIPGTAAPAALLEAVGALWGLEPAAPEAALLTAPMLPPDWPGMALRRLRVGRTLLDLELRRRAGALVLRAAHRFGPRLVLTAAPQGPDIEAVEVDDVALAGGRARFEMHGRHEVRFLLRD